MVQAAKNAIGDDKVNELMNKFIKQPDTKTTAKKAVKKVSLTKDETK